MKLFLNFTILASFLFSACAGVKLYKEENFTNRTGLKFYYPKPYLLVERNGAKDVPLKTTIIYLPDLANPVYAKVMNGFGANEFSLALANGALSSYGVKTDSKIPETIAAAGGVLTGVGGVLSGVGAIKTAAGGDVKQDASVKDLREIKVTIDRARSDLDASVTFPDFITQNQKGSLELAKAEIQNTQKIVNALDPQQIKDIIASIDKVKKYLEAVECKQETKECKNFNGKFISIIDQLTKAKEQIQPVDNSVLPSFELYEIIPNGSAISCKLVKFTTAN